MTSAPIRDPLADHLLTPENAALETKKSGHFVCPGRCPSCWSLRQ